VQSPISIEVLTLIVQAMSKRLFARGDLVGIERSDALENIREMLGGSGISGEDAISIDRGRDHRCISIFFGWDVP